MNRAVHQWNPATYLSFAAHRARPVEDLLPRIHLSADGAIYDLGCGPGTVTLKLRQRWPTRRVLGLDSSAAMLEAARARYGAEEITWLDADIATWRAAQPAALLFANAALHWVPNHRTLFPRLMESLAPGGVLAVQMPTGGDAPYHTCIHDLLRKPRWQTSLGHVRSYDPPLTASAYYDLISPLAETVDIWETDYHHVLPGRDPVAAWAHGTALVPYLSVLDEDTQYAFVADYAAATAKAYPPRADGNTLFTMRRIFILATRR